MRLRAVGMVVVAVSLVAVFGGSVGRAHAARGAQATPAVTKAAAYKVVSGPTVTVAAGKGATLKATCPTGTVAVGGGELDSSKSTLVTLSGSYPSGQTWISTVQNGGGASIKAHARAVCIPKPAKFKVVNVSVSNPAQHQTEGEADCPSGKFAIGGGVKTSSTAQQAVNSTYTGNGLNWLVFENNRDQTAHGMHVYAICAKTDFTVVQSSPVTNPGGVPASGSVSCPPGDVPVSGGVASVSTDLYADVNATAPTAGGWRVTMDNVTSAPTNFTVYAICGGFAG